ncbi:MAG: GIY-YIG nuclease family protein, partial [Aeriscardovia sp.]|nr:GIY-YIG nuclease family protein [Aeriscardovia sp.]
MSKHYVYIFEDEFANILYVGKTSQDFDKRMQQHLSGKSSLNSECLKKLKRIKYIEYDYLCDAAMMEIYLMNYYKTPYNNSDNENMTGIYNLPIPNEDLWNIYALKKDDTTIDINIVDKLKQVFDSNIILNEELEN